MSTKIPFLRKNEEIPQSLQSQAYQNPDYFISFMINPKGRQLTSKGKQHSPTKHHIGIQLLPKINYSQQQIQLALNHTYQELYQYYEKNFNILHNAKKVIAYKMKYESIKSHHIRKKIWMLVSGALQKQIRHQKYYEKILIYPDYPDYYKKIIEADVVRTIPSKEDSELQMVLRNLLIAYARRNPAIGYCQGMNFIANFLVTMQFAAEQCFWLMTSVFQDIVPMEYYTNMMGVAVDLKILKQIIRVKYPKLHDKIEDLGVDISIFMLQWLVCLFSTALPFSLSVIVWDLLLSQGSVVLLKTALVILQFYAPIILNSQDFSDFLMKMQEKKKKIIINQIQFMDRLFCSYIDPNILELLRKVYSFQLTKEKQNQQRQNQLNPRYLKQKQKWKQFGCDKKWPICFQLMKRNKSNNSETDFWVIRSAQQPKIINKYVQASQRKRRQSVHLDDLNLNDERVYKQLAIGRITHICNNKQSSQDPNFKIVYEDIEMDDFEFGFRKNLRNISSLMKGKKIMSKLKQEQQKNFGDILSGAITTGLNQQSKQQKYKFNT